MKKLSKENIYVGIVGTGLMGSAHTKALRWNDIEVAGILGSSYEKSVQAAKDLGIAKAYQSFEELVNDDQIDVIHLTTPNHLHYPHAKAALLAGKHVVCEKPFTVNTAESKELMLLGREKNLVTAVNFNFRMTAMVQKALEIVRSGDIGKPFIIHGSYLQDWLLYPTDWNWRLDTNVGGQLRTVGDIGSHWLDLVSYVSGLRILEVFADFKTFHDKRYKLTETGKQQEIQIDSEDYASILIHFENGVQGVLSISQLCAGHKNRLFFEINGSKSSIAWDAEQSDQLWRGYRDHENQILEDEEKKESSLEKRKQTSADTIKELYRRIYTY
ncbi:MAG: Gfo/Idh/MocA family oxidoreductase, partial [Anaerolineaceae bacterium]|nr:Gfo/Idh/MocA family oxidoreductase [Anaerolineaceae bacterium]